MSRLALMTAISRFGWQPNLFLWEDGSERIMAVRLTSPASGDHFDMFYTRDHGHVPFLQRDPELICNEVNCKLILHSHSYQHILPIKLSASLIIGKGILDNPS